MNLQQVLNLLGKHETEIKCPDTDTSGNANIGNG